MSRIRGQELGRGDKGVLYETPLKGDVE